MSKPRRTTPTRSKAPAAPPRTPRTLAAPRLPAVAPSSTRARGRPFLRQTERSSPHATRSRPVGDVEGRFKDPVDVLFTEVKCVEGFFSELRLRFIADSSAPASVGGSYPYR